MRDYRSAREFFISLKWSDHEKDSPRVFTEYEIETMPLKWLKYLLLERVGLTSMKQLEQSIHRFSPADVNKAKEYCHATLESHISNDYRSLIIVKVVYFEQAGQLPNFRITIEEDIASIFDGDLKPYMRTAYEIWLCESDIAESGINLGGRLAYPLGNVYQDTVVELVWYSSPRRIEEYRSHSFRFPFLGARRRPGSSQFVVDVMHIPFKYQSETATAPNLLADFHWVLQRLYDHSEPRQRLEQILRGAGAKELSLEFKASSGRFSIIDWDTEIETAL